MKKTVNPITTKISLIMASVVLFLLASCAHKQTVMTSSANADIVWNSPAGIPEITNQEVAAKAGKELSKNDFKTIISEQLATGKVGNKLTLKEKIASNVLANKINKAYQKLSPTQKVSFKEQMTTQKGNDGLKQAVIVMLIGLGICVIGSFFWTLSTYILGNIITLIGAIVFLYGLWLLLEELVF
jgi:hypothetical protein